MKYKIPVDKWGLDQVFYVFGIIITAIQLKPSIKGQVKNMEQEMLCHDCGKELSLNSNQELEGGVSLVYENANEKINVLKCDACYAKSPALTNFQPCEVYSRVVGYIRPVQQWHKGKRQEYGDRVEFIAPGGS